MPVLTLLRHAKSDWSDPSGTDAERPLNGRGLRAARAIGRYMADEGLAFDRVLASPARRVQETIAGVEAALGRSLGAEATPAIYLADLETLLDLVREQGEVERLLLIGHSPGLEELALRLAAPGALRDELAIKYPTAALAELTSEGAWEAGRALLTRFVRPRDLDAGLGPDA